MRGYKISEVELKKIEHIEVVPHHTPMLEEWFDTLNGHSESLRMFMFFVSIGEVNVPRYKRTLRISQSEAQTAFNKLIEIGYVKRKDDVNE